MSMPAELMTETITLKELLEGIVDATAIPVNGIAADSRVLQRGEVFLACQGASSHGLDYLRQAEAAGAVAVVWDHPTLDEVAAEIPTLRVVGLAEQLGEIANRWFDHPSRDVAVTGVTGTNGKTTTAFLIQQCLRLLKKPCGYIGTLGSGLSEISGDGSMTTPACIELHAELAAFRDDGARHAAMEVSSHAIDQARVDGVQFEAAIFTNLSRDHIDYHGGMREYFETKARLFLDFDVTHRIVSLDTEFGVELADRCGSDVVAVSMDIEQVANGKHYVFVRDVIASNTGSKVSITSSWGDGEFAIEMPGAFNVANAVQVLALLLCQGVSIDAACRVLGKVTAPPGRMQLVASANAGEPIVYVDYSHTPASLEAALNALRGHCGGKLWCVFGCGGDRDKGKRPMMGEVAERLSDVAIVTSDNPRTEDPDAIILDVLAGMQKNAVTIADRNAAIKCAIREAATGDTILVAGKGHEYYQIVGKQRLRFSDSEVAAEHLAARAAQSADRS